MAFQTPIFVQNENLPIHRGKGVDGTKVDLPKPPKVVNQDRKALRDLSRVGKPTVFDASKGTNVKGKSSLSSLKTSKSDQKSAFIIDDEIRRCNEWAKEGIEHAHYTGNDMLKNQKDKKEERIVKKVNKVLTALREWNDLVFGIIVPLEKNPRDSDDVTVIDLMPEVLPTINARIPKSGIDEESEDFLSDYDLDEFLLMDCTTELKLKDDSDDHDNNDGDYDELWIYP